MVYFNVFDLLITGHTMKEDMMTKPETIDDYIAGFPEDVREVLEEVRAAIRKVAPDAAEGISYAMPAFTLAKKPLVYFAAFKHHIGLYALPTGHAAFAEEFAGYKSGKGSVQFPLGRPMPLELIARVVKFRLNELKEQALLKKK